MAKLDGVAVLLGKHPQEGVEPLGVEMEVRRELPEYGPKVFLQQSRALEENVDRFPVHVQLLHVRNEAASFDRVDEPFRSALVPAADHRLGREAVKARVDFDRVEL